MMRWKLYCIRCFLIWCLGSKECSYSLENTPSNDIPYTTKQILNICVQGGTSYAKAPRRKVWTQTKILSPNTRYFVAILRFVAIYALCGNLWAKKVPFGSKTVFLGQEVHYYMVYIAYFTELILQICDYAQKRRI